MIDGILNSILDGIKNKLNLFHTVESTDTATPETTKAAEITTPATAKRPLHSVEVVSTEPRTVRFTVSGTVDGRTANRIEGGEHNTTDSIKTLMIRLFREQRGITNAQVTDPADNRRYDVHRRGNSIAIFTEDNTYSEEFAI